MISNAAVFWPSMRWGLMELTTATGRAGVRRLAHEAQGVVEVAVDGHALGAVDHSLHQLAQRDLAQRKQHVAGEARAGRVGGGGGRSVPGGGADDRLRPGFDRLGDGHRHAPVLERTRGVQPLVLQEHAAAASDDLAQARGVDERGRAFVERNDGSGRGDGQELPPAGDHATVIVKRAVHTAGMTRQDTRKLPVAPTRLCRFSAPVGPEDLPPGFNPRRHRRSPARVPAARRAGSSPRKARARIR